MFDLNFGFDAMAFILFKRERNIFSNANSEACFLKFKTNNNQITREWGCKKGCIDKFFDVFVGEHLKCFDENAKMRAAKQRWEQPLPLMFVDVTLSKRLTTTRGGGGRRVWDEKLFAGMRRLLLNTIFCVYNTNIYILVNCAHVHICVKSVQMMKLNMIMHLRRYDKRILLEELCPGNLSPFCFTIFSHSSKIQQINELFLFVSCKM